MIHCSCFCNDFRYELIPMVTCPYNKQNLVHKHVDYFLQVKNLSIGQPQTSKVLHAEMLRTNHYDDGAYVNSPKNLNYHHNISKEKNARSQSTILHIQPKHLIHLCPKNRIENLKKQEKTKSKKKKSI